MNTASYENASEQEGLGKDPALSSEATKLQSNVEGLEFDANDQSSPYDAFEFEVLNEIADIEENTKEFEFDANDQSSPYDAFEFDVEEQSAKKVATHRRNRPSQRTNGRSYRPVKYDRTKTRETQRKHRVGRFAGGVLLAGLAFVGSLGLGNAISSIGHQSADAHPARGDDTEQEVVAERVSTTVTTTTEAPAETTTTTPETRYTVEIGKEIGTAIYPSTCNIVHTKMISVEQNDSTGTGRSPLDAMVQIPPEAKQQACEQAVRRANDMGYKDRTARDTFARQGEKHPYPTIDGRRSTASDYLAIAGIVEDANGYLPGDKIGHYVSFGHGSTDGSPYNDLGATNIGDKKIFIRSDGKILVSTAVKKEIIPFNGREAEATDEIYNYIDGINPATGTYSGSYSSDYACSGLDGKPGSDAARLVVRWKEDGPITPAQLRNLLTPDFISQLRAQGIDVSQGNRVTYNQV